jgi:hypothetical protein
MKERYFFGGSQASNVRPSGNNNVYMKTSMRHLWNSYSDVAIKTKSGNVLWVNNMCLLWDLFIHSVICLTTGPTPLPKRFLHIVRSRASSFKWEYFLLSLRLSSSFLRLLPRPLFTSISPFIFPSINCFRRQFRREIYIERINTLCWRNVEFFTLNVARRKVITGL